jgi:alpha-1,4-digalacturonate transport system permease protein
MGKALGRLAPHLVLLAFSCATLAPFAWALVQSFEPLTTDVTWTTNNYNQVIDYGPFITSYLNSIIVAGTVMASAVLTSIPVGFVLSRYHFRGKDQLFTVLIAAIMIPFSVILIPIYVTVVHLGLDGSLGGLIIAGLWSPFGIFTVRQFMNTIPNELLDAARVEGTAEWRIIVQLMVPLCAPALTVLAVYTFMQSWDSFFLPAILLHRPDNWTLPVLLANGLGASTPVVSAVVILTTLPTLIITVITVRYFMQGIVLSSWDG